MTHLLRGKELPSFFKKFFFCFTVWSLKPSSLEGADVIITQAAGSTKDGESGKINTYLAAIVQEICREYNLPIIAQGEVAECLKEFPLVGSIPSQKEAKSYITTLDVAKMHKKECDAHGWKRPILVASKIHLWRAMMASRKLGLDVVIPPIYKNVYDAKCSQWWGRNFFYAYSRELYYRLLWLLQGKI